MPDDIKNPLWMPVGSVRAILALVCIAATVAMFFCEIDIPEAWWAILASVSTFYFTVRP